MNDPSQFGVRLSGFLVIAALVALGAWRAGTARPLLFAMLGTLAVTMALQSLTPFVQGEPRVTGQAAITLTSLAARGPFLSVLIFPFIIRTRGPKAVCIAAVLCYVTAYAGLFVSAILLEMFGLIRIKLFA